MASREFGQREQRVAVWIAVGEQEHVRPHLGAVAERVRGGVAQPAGEHAAREAREPPHQRDRVQEAATGQGVGGGARTSARAEAGRARQGPEEQQGGQRQDAAQRHRPTALRLRRLDRDVHGIPGPAVEGRIWVGGQIKVAIELRGVFDVAREEYVKEPWRASTYERRDPVGYRHQ